MLQAQYKTFLPAANGVWRPTVVSLSLVYVLVPRHGILYIHGLVRNASGRPQPIRC